MRANRFLSLCLPAAALIAASPAAAAAPTLAPAPSVRTDVPTQLPRNAIPIHYTIRAMPDAANLRFAATVAIDLTVTQPSRALTLNAAELSFETVTVTPQGGKPMAAQVAVNADAQTVTFSFPRVLAKGRYRLDITYAGVINTQANGLFALDYSDNDGARQRALFTQFEAPDARRFFPGWDEPAYKTSYDLAVVVPAGQMAVSNTPAASETTLPGGAREIRFATTPRMSSYLLFFGMGNLERATMKAGATEVGVVTGAGNTPKARYALESSAQILPYYNDYFGVDYPLPKLDNVAGPGQSQFFSAMENWGAIFYFEPELLFDAKRATVSNQQRIYTVVAHEMAHQWFGDLVTMAWWDDLWLNEGFASWMATKATDHFNPEWEMTLTRVDGREAAMALDAYASTHPVVQHVRTVEETSQAFDTITYQKGEAVITMLEQFAGADVWRQGLRSYMKRHAYANTVTDDLWQAVEQAGATGLVGIAHDFTRQPGIPLVRVGASRCEGGQTVVDLAQSEFSRDRAGKAPLRLQVPVMARAGDGAEQRLILKGTGTMRLPGCGPLLVNAGQTGYYRTLYQPAQLAALQAALPKLPLIDQTGLIKDQWALGLAGSAPLAGALDLMASIRADAPPATLRAQADVISDMAGLAGGNAALRGQVGAFATARLGPVLQRIGFDARAGEAAPVPLLRATLVELLGDLGDPTVVAEARRRFAALDRDPAALDGPLQQTWLTIVAKSADAASWDRLRARANASRDATERGNLFALLGRAQDKALAARALDLALTPEPGQTNSAAILAAAAQDHPDQVIDFALAHITQVEGLVDSSSRSRALARWATRSADPAMIDKLEGYAKARLTPQSRKPVDQAIAAVRGRIAMRDGRVPELTAWLSRAGR